MNRSLVINFVGQLRVEVAKGIVGEPGKMKYRIKTIEVGWRNVPDVFANRGELTRRLAECALLEQAAIQADDFVTGVSQEWSHDGSDVPKVPSQQHAHEMISPKSRELTNLVRCFRFGGSNQGATRAWRLGSRRIRR